MYASNAAKHPLRTWICTSAMDGRTAPSAWSRQSSRRHQLARRASLETSACKLLHTRSQRREHVFYWLSIFISPSIQVLYLSMNGCLRSFTDVVRGTKDPTIRATQDRVHGLCVPPCAPQQIERECASIDITVQHCDHKCLYTGRGRCDEEASKLGACCPCAQARRGRCAPDGPQGK